MAEVMSKSAKKRAAQKARDAAAAEAEAPAPVPAPAPAAAAPKSKAAAKSAPAASPASKAAAAPVEAAAKGKAKAAADPKASAKAAAKSQPAPAAVKASAKSQPAPAPATEPAAAGKKKKEATAEPAPPAPAAAAPAASKAAAKGKAKAKATPAPAPPVEEATAFTVLDDGTGGDWEVAAGVSKKEKNKKDKQEEKKADDKAKGPLYKTDKNSGYPAKGKGKGSAEIASAKVGSRLDMEALTKAVQAEAAAAVAAYNRPTADGAKAEEVKAPQFTRQVWLPADKIGRVIGPKGANVQKITEHFEGKITRIDTEAGLCKISGDDEEAVAQAENAVKDLISKGFMSLSYKNFTEDTVTVKSMYLPEIIGKQGAIIKKIKEVTSVEIDIPQESGKGKGAAPAADADGAKGKGKGADDGGKPVKIALAGEADDVEKAKNIIQDICKYFCHPAIHDGFVHGEMEVEQDMHRFIIGRGGSEMRHIQKNWNVKVNLPKWDWNGKLISENEKVVVVGMEDDVSRAKAYIEKTLSTASVDNKEWDEKQATVGKGQGDRLDKDDGPVEEWMKPYMYKR